jgi:hypothetical protein
LLRDVALLVVLVAVLIGARAAALLTADLHHVITAAPGELLYTATFDDFLDDWALYEGRLSAQVEDAVLRLAVDTPQSSPFSTTTPHFGDFDLRVKTHPIAGPLDNGYGVIFRLQDAQNYYWFMISSDGYYQVLRSVDGEQKELSTWIDSTLINQGLEAENWLRVVGQGDQFEFFINDEQVTLCIPDDPAGESTFVADCVDGQMLDTLVDDSISTGQLGVVARSFNDPGVEVKFDNVLVYGPAVSSES